jgi:Lon protease-like protein
MRQTLPLFPLGTVLFPGLVMPLHVFEDRYRQMVNDLLAGPEPRSFGVIAIRQGRETGVDGVRSLHQIGCTATIREANPHSDGGFDLVTVGGQRFRLIEVDESAAYRRAEVRLLEEEVGDAPDLEFTVKAVQEAFQIYLDALTIQGDVRVSVPDLPAEPVLLSYLVAASMIIELPVKQSLLSQPTAARRLTAERALLSRETTMLQTLASAPAPDLRDSPYNPN